MESDPAFHEVDNAGEDYRFQPPFDPDSTRVVEVELARARGDLDSLRSKAGLISSVLTAIRAQRDRLEAELAAMQSASREAVLAADGARQLFEQHVVDAYMGGRDLEMVASLGAASSNEAMTRHELVRAVLTHDATSVDEYLDLRESLDGRGLKVLDSMADLDRQARLGLLLAQDLRAEIEAAELQVAIWEAGSQVAVQGFVFPVFGPNTFGDSWGAPRMVGTPWEHWHEGTDIMARAGTPLVAVETGKILRVRSHHLGGNGVTMVGLSGLEYYYAHLSRYVDGLSEGDTVVAGEVIGYVGDTGNARGGSPHLHFEIADHGRAVNPFPILAVIWERQGPYILAQSRDRD